MESKEEVDSEESDDRWLARTFKQIWDQMNELILSKFYIFTNAAQWAYQGKVPQEANGTIVPLGHCPCGLNTNMEWYVFIYIISSK